jgi:hypothetical protein
VVGHDRIIPQLSSPPAADTIDIINATATAESRTAPGSTANYRSTTTIAAACRHISFVSNTAVSW